MKSLRRPGAIVPVAFVLLTGCTTSVDPALGEGALLRDLRAVEAERRELEAAAREEAAARDGLPQVSTFQAERLLELRDRRRELVRDGLERATLERSETVTEAALVAFLAEVAATPLPAALWSESSEDCPDLVADAILFDLGESILADDRAAYASALARVALSYECHSLFDGYLANATILAAYERALGRFAGIERLTARRALLASLANLFVLAQDATKSFGPTKLHRFLQDERRALGEVFSQPHSPIRLAGLWLFHPASNRMVRISSFCEARLPGPVAPGDAAAIEPCVSGTAALDALLDAARLGTGACALVDMLPERLDPELGYLCQRNACAGPESGIPGIERMHANGQTPHGLPIETLRAMHCPDGSAGSGANADLVGVLSRLGDVGTCITTTLLEDSGFGREECVADVARRDRSPTFLSPPERNETCGDPLAQDVPPGLEGLPACQESLEAPACKLALGSAWAREQLERFILGSNAGQPLPDPAVQDRLRRLWEALGEVGTTPEDAGVTIVDSPDGMEIEIGDEDLVDLSVLGIGKKLFVTVLGFIVETGLSDRLDEEAGQTEEQMEGPPGDPEDPADGGVDEYCSPTLGDCGDCSPGAARRAALLECLGFEDEAPREDPPGGGFTDPPPWDDPADSAWAACLALREDDEAAEQGSLACAAELDCGDGVLPVRGPDGCHCPDGGGGPVARVNGCAWTDFEDCARPVAGPGGRCFCDDPLTPILGSPEGPTPDPQRLESVIGCANPRPLAEWEADELPLYGASREECRALGELVR